MNFSSDDFVTVQMRADFDQEKKRAVNVATRSLERDLERLKADHATEVEELVENHKQELSENKKKQWVSGPIHKTGALHGRKFFLKKSEQFSGKRRWR